jgi:RimJ/RimL family protein N-acetyltransferase
MRFPDEVPTMSAGDVTLRAHRVDDGPAIVEQCTDPVSVRWTTVPLGYDLAMAETWVQESIPPRWESGAERMFAIETTHPDGVRRFSGSLSLRDHGDGRAEIAFGAHPAARGRGVMTTAVDLLLDYGFSDQVGLETVGWYAEVGNAASRRVAWKTGFTFGGRMPRWLPHRGEMVDGWVGTLHRDDPRTPTTRWVEAPVLDGDGVRLRPLREDDVPRLVEACSDARAQHWLEFLPSPYTAADALDFLHRSCERQPTGVGADWAVVDPADDQLLANVGIPRSSTGSYEIGYLAHPDARGRGVVTRAVGTLLTHLFGPEESGGMAARRAFLTAAGGNTASQHVARSNGFTEYGRERESILTRDGTPEDLVLFEMLRAGFIG